MATAPEGTEEIERHATNLELFLDLVFVFAVTQITSTLEHDLTWAGVGRGLLISWLVWWQWSQYTWAGSAVDLQREPWTRLLVLSTIPAALTVAAAIPEAFHGGGPWFGVAFLITQALVLAMQGSTALREERTRRAFLRYASVAAVMPVIVAIGGFGHGHVRVAAWCIAGASNVVGAFRGAAGEWEINPAHFAERHGLFIIIALGEALVAIGAATSQAGLTARTVIGLLVAAALACTVWWTYFAYLPDVTAHQLRVASPARRAVVARDLFTFGHFPLVVGIVFYSVVAKDIVLHPTAALPANGRWLLAAAVALLLAGYLHIQWRVVHGLARERLVAIPVVAVLCVVASRLAGVVLLALVGLVLAAAQMITWRNFRRGALGHVATNR